MYDDKIKIAFIGQPEYFRFIYEDFLIENDFCEAREFPFMFDMTESDLKEILDFNAEYNFFFRGEFFPNSILQKLSGVNIALSSEPFPRKINNKWELTRDSLKRYCVFRAIRSKNFDYVFHYDKSSMDLFKLDKMAIFDDFVFPVALKTYRKKEFIDYNERKWDLFFIGRSTKHREELFSPLKHHFNFLHINHGIYGSELVDYMNKSKICINAHAENEVSWEPRLQMMLATGAFVLSEKITPNSYLKPGFDYIEYSDKDDLYKKVEFYVSHPEKMAEIVNNARRTVDKYFDSRRVFSELIREIDKYKKFVPSSAGDNVVVSVIAQTIIKFL